MAGIGNWRVCVAVLGILIAVGSGWHGTEAAAAALTFCEPGAAAGQCANAADVDIDVDTRQVYVADSGNNRVSVFSDSGEFLFSFGWDVVPGGATGLEKCTTATGCKAGSSGGGVGQLSSPGSVAIDNSAGSPGLHSIYVYDNGNKRVQKFDPEGGYQATVGGFDGPFNPIAVGPGGTVYVGDSRGFDEEAWLMSFDAALEPVGECRLPKDDLLNHGIAVNSAGVVYAAFNLGGGYYMFDLSCGQLGMIEPDADVTALAIDQLDHLYVAKREPKVLGPGSYRIVTKHDAGGAVLHRYGYGTLQFFVTGVAPLLDGGSGNLFASQKGSAVNGVIYIEEPAAGPVVAAASAVEPVPNVRATINAEVNPEGKAAEVEIDYLDQARFETEGGFASPFTKTEGPFEVGEGATDAALHGVTAEIGCEVATKEQIENEECLTPDTQYRFRVRASNEDGSGAGPVEGTFETSGLGEIEDTFASEVGPDSARLSLTVNPLGIETSGYFEYVDQATYEASEYAEALVAPQGDELNFGTGEAGVTRSVAVNLDPATTYRFRARATNLLVEEALEGEEVLFTTFAAEGPPEMCSANALYRSGLSARLPDCRAYELVSPLDKEGGDITVVNELSPYSLPAVLAKSAVAGDKVSFGSYRAFDGAEAAPLTSQYVAVRGTDSWESHSVLGPRGHLNAQTSSVLDSELKGLSPDLCEAWIRTVAEPKLAPNAIEGKANLYRRVDESCGGESYEAVSTAVPHGAGLAEWQGASADGSASIYVLPDNLTPDSPVGKGLELYYQSAGEGQPHFVCYDTAGEPIDASCGGGITPDTVGKGRAASVTGAISADGARVFWSTPASSKSAKLYVRERPGQPQSAVVGELCTEAQKACTIAVSSDAEAEEGTSSSTFWWAAEDGSKAIFTTGDGLYEFNVDDRLTTPIAENGVLGVMGASADASRVYFASTGVIPSVGPNSQGDEPQPGEPNLYLAHEGDFRFVGTLDAATDVIPSIFAAINLEPVKRTARVSDDGLHAAFMSSASLTGYDNTDASSGEANAEVFRFDATANEGAGATICVSCNPSGARPRGLDIFKGSNEFWAAARLPVWKSATYPGRVMSEDGSRVYFESYDVLVPRDSNGATDVYQWEEAGSGGCQETDPSYSSQNEGCVELISSGQSDGGAAYIDTSESGDDVFFTTVAGLVDFDYGLIDVYDARVDGGLPAPPAPASECEGEQCQNPAPAPPSSPATSQLYDGPTNPPPPKAKKKPRRCPKSKRQVKRKGKVRCVKKKGTKHRTKRHAKHRRVKGDGR